MSWMGEFREQIDPRKWSNRASKAIALLKGGMRSLSVQVTPDVDIRIPVSAQIHFWAGLHEDQRSLAFLNESLPAGGTFFDVGANIGIYTSALSRMKRGALKVVAFEPIPSTIAILQETFLLNEVKAQIEPVALSSQVGELKLSAFGAGLNNFWIKDANADVPSISVRTETLDGWMARHPEQTPSAIKIDVEGHELEVLEGAVETLRRHRPALMVECHCAAWDELGVSRKRFDELIRSIGYGRITDAGGARVDFFQASSTFHLLAKRE